jgi:hypothetical protein
MTQTLDPVLATDGRMTYLELAPDCLWYGYMFIVRYPGAGNIAYVEIILPAPRTVKTILHSSREFCYPYSIANGKYITFSIGDSYATKQDCYT